LSNTFRRTKIVATLGPASTGPAVLRKLIQTGVDIVRLNFSHGTLEEKESEIAEARRIAAELGRPLSILQDLQGPKIRVGSLEEPLNLEKGDRIRIRGGDFRGNKHELSISYDSLAQEMHPGDLIYLDDGLLELRVVEVSDVVEAEVMVGGRLGEHKGVNLPDVDLETPAMTPKDERDLRFGLAAGVDMVALSFVRRPEDALPVRKIIAEAGHDQLLIAKIEKREALENIDRIMFSFDGVMVARGDLGVEIGHERVPTAQKQIIRLANSVGRPVITATQMLESMTYNSLPTRAEASDVANAVLDGSDAVMLSGETAVGHYPVETVRTMDRIIREAETETMSLREPASSFEPDTNAFCSAAARLAAEMGVSALAALTRSGGTARSLSSIRPALPIFALCTSETLARSLNLWRGVVPLVIDPGQAIEEASGIIARVLHDRALLQPGSEIVIVGVSPASPYARTDFIRLMEI
jgi:pyruvate kinase